MGRFINAAGVTFSVDDSKDERYQGEGYKPADGADKKAPAKKAASSKSDDK